MNGSYSPQGNHDDTSYLPSHGSSPSPTSCLALCTGGGGGNGSSENGDFCGIGVIPSLAPPKRDPESLVEAEKAISKELYELSMQEREGALHDLHGVADEIEEHPEFVQFHLNELETELQSPRYNSCDAFHITMSQAPHYVRGMYLMFLRSEEFDVRLAAERMMKHFDMKRDLFGVEKLGRDITLGDLSRNDKECLESGFLQMLPQRDRAGRVVFIKIWYHQTYKERENVWRAIWYLEMSILHDELTQKRGKVSILYNVTSDWIEQFDRELFKGVGRLKKATPVRTVAAHYCFSDPAFGAIIQFITRFVMDRKTRTRTRLHQGTHVEIQYELMSFGVPMSAVPLNSDGVITRKAHLKWIKTLHALEMIKCTPNGPRVVLFPSHVDVLFGRGKIFQLHLGNMKWAQVLEDESERYFGAKREEKVGIALEIARRMKNEDGVRFLRQEKDGLWVEVDEKTATDKVGHGFRNRKPVKPVPPRKTPPKEKRTTPTAPTGSAPPTSTDPFIQEYVVGKRFRFDGDAK